MLCLTSYDHWKYAKTLRVPLHDSGGAQPPPPYLSAEEGGIGFRMIHEFNLAFLAKQLWCIIQFRDSLLVHVLRGKYYRLSLPLQAIDIDTPSYSC